MGAPSPLLRIRVQLVFGPRVKVRPCVALPQLAFLGPPGLVHFLAAHHGLSRSDSMGPLHDVRVRLLNVKERLSITIHLTKSENSIPRPDHDVRQGVLVSAEVRPAVLELIVQDIELALSLEGESVDRILDLHRRIVVEVAEPAAQVGPGPHLPHDPRDHLGPSSWLFPGTCPPCHTCRQDREGWPQTRRHSPGLPGRSGLRGPGSSSSGSLRRTQN
mmetsp:Transcript_23318/g.68070  ORF Transcript_23318/g.68070 Transcript_23318/m.68070 type:complete len:217 (-) Transcript_23318:424-1074(-)